MTKNTCGIEITESEIDDQILKPCDAPSVLGRMLIYVYPGRCPWATE
jgi:hypothetical protein